MWTLFIISTVIGLDEPKVTRYAEFDHWQECQDAWRQVSYEFTQEEIAYCAGPDE